MARDGRTAPTYGHRLDRPADAPDLTTATCRACGDTYALWTGGNLGEGSWIRPVSAAAPRWCPEGDRPYPMVNITDVYPDAEPILSEQLKPGMFLFDAFGGRHRVAHVVTLKHGTVKATREDGWIDRFKPAERITIARTATPPQA